MSQFRIKYRKPVVVFGLAVLLVLFSLPTVLAGEGRTDEVVHIKADEVVNDDLFASGLELHWRSQPKAIRKIVAQFGLGCADTHHCPDWAGPDDG
jgi:hypothetical protein